MRPGRTQTGIFWFFDSLLKNEERNVLGIEEIRFKTDHSQHGDDKKPTGRLRIYAPKIIFFFELQKIEKKEVLEKKKEVLNFYTPFSIHFAATYR